MSTQYRSFGDFYPFYLSQHQNSTCRRLHVAGLILGCSLFVFGLVLARPQLLIVAFFVGYGFGWVGHFVFERNRPASFRYPLYSFIGDWAMAKDVLTGKLPL